MTGVGIDVTLSTEGKIIATLIHKDSAAEKAGMRKGDVITAVDGTEVKKEDFAAVKSKLENAAKVLVTVSRFIASHGPDIAALSQATESIALDVRQALMEATVEGSENQ